MDRLAQAQGVSGRIFRLDDGGSPGSGLGLSGFGVRFSRLWAGGKGGGRSAGGPLEATIVARARFRLQVGFASRGLDLVKACCAGQRSMLQTDIGTAYHIGTAYSKLLKLRLPKGLV